MYTCEIPPRPSLTTRMEPWGKCYLMIVFHEFRVKGSGFVVFYLATSKKVTFYLSAHANLSGTTGSSSLTSVANYSGVIEYIDHVINRAREKYDVQAYLHWYWKHGCQQVTSSAMDPKAQLSFKDTRYA